MPINARSSRIDLASMLINVGSILHDLALISIDRHWEKFRMNAMILISIDPRSPVTGTSTMWDFTLQTLLKRAYSRQEMKDVLFHHVISFKKKELLTERNLIDFLSWTTAKHYFCMTWLNSVISGRKWINIQVLLSYLDRLSPEVKFASKVIKIHGSGKRLCFVCTQVDEEWPLM